MELTDMNRVDIELKATDKKIYKLYTGNYSYIIRGRKNVLINTSGAEVLKIDRLIDGKDITYTKIVDVLYKRLQYEHSCK